MQKTEFATGSVRPLDIIKRAVCGYLRDEQIAGGVFRERVHLAIVQVELLDRERSQPAIIAITIASDSGGLEYNLTLLAGDPSGCRVERIAFRDFGQPRAIGQ